MPANAGFIELMRFDWLVSSDDNMLVVSVRVIYIFFLFSRLSDYARVNCTAFFFFYLSDIIFIIVFPPAKLVTLRSFVCRSLRRFCVPRVEVFLFNLFVFPVLVSTSRVFCHSPSVWRQTVSLTL